MHGATNLKIHFPYPDTLTAVAMCHVCKQIGHFPLYLAPLTSRLGGSGTGKLVKFPWLASFCHHWMNCRKNADNSKPRKMTLVRTAECLMIERYYLVNLIQDREKETPPCQYSLKIAFEKIAPTPVVLLSCRQVG